MKLTSKSVFVPGIGSGVCIESVGPQHLIQFPVMGITGRPGVSWCHTLDITLV